MYDHVDVVQLCSKEVELHASKIDIWSSFLPEVVVSQVGSIPVSRPLALYLFGCLSPSPSLRRYSSHLMSPISCFVSSSCIMDFSRVLISHFRSSLLCSFVYLIFYFRSSLLCSSACSIFDVRSSTSQSSANSKLYMTASDPLDLMMKLV